MSLRDWKMVEKMVVLRADSKATHWVGQKAVMLANYWVGGWVVLRAMRLAAL